MDLRDLVVLGRAAPDDLKDGRQTVCVGGWSSSYGFIRLYPTNVVSDLNRWNIVEVPVERNESDDRFESWKIKGSRSEWNELHRKIKRVGRLEGSSRWKLINQIPKVGCISELNDKHASLGLIWPRKIVGFGLRDRESWDHGRQMSLTDFGGFEYSQHLFRVMTKRHFPFVPFIEWECPGPCGLKQGYHHSQVLEWGVYEWFRKVNFDREKCEQVFDNLHLEDESWSRWFFVGNLHRYRRSFMIISVLRFKNRGNNIPAGSLSDFL